MSIVAHPQAVAACSRRRVLALLGSGLGSLFVAPFAIAANSNPDSFIYGKDIEGHDVMSLATPATKYIAAVFVATDCPISNRYLPMLEQLSLQFAPLGARLWLVYPNPGDTVKSV